MIFACLHVFLCPDKYWLSVKKEFVLDMKSKNDFCRVFNTCSVMVLFANEKGQTDSKYLHAGK